MVSTVPCDPRSIRQSRLLLGSPLQRLLGDTDMTNIPESDEPPSVMVGPSSKWNILLTGNIQLGFRSD